MHILTPLKIKHICFSKIHLLILYYKKVILILMVPRKVHSQCIFAWTSFTADCTRVLADSVASVYVVPHARTRHGRVPTQDAVPHVIHRASNCKLTQV